jgi:hypothetical protein
LAAVRVWAFGVGFYNLFLVRHDRWRDRVGALGEGVPPLIAIVASLI